MPTSGTRRKRPRGVIEELPSGSLRVTVYAGIDPVTKRRHYLREVIAAGPKASRMAEAARTRLLSQVDEQRQPRTNATVNQLLDQHFEMSTWERSTRETYAGYATKHIRPLLGSVQVGALNARTFDSFHAELRRCRDHCGRARYVDHRTPYPHECDERCRMHSCQPLGAATIRQIHFSPNGRRAEARRPLGLDLVEPDRLRGDPARAEGQAAAAVARGGRADPHRGVGRSGLGHAGVARDRDRRAAGRAVRAPVD